MHPITSLRGGSISHLTHPYTVMEPIPFLKQFGDLRADVVGPGEDIHSSDRSVTSFNIDQGISLFALEKEGNKTTAVLCWHIEETTPVYAIVKETSLEEIDREESCVRCFEMDKTYAFYIVGGKKETIQGSNSLLSHIKKMIQDEFHSSAIQLEVLYPAPHPKIFVSANLQRNGTLTLCFHDQKYRERA